MDRMAFRSMVLQRLTAGQTSSDADPSEGGLSSVEVNRTGAVRMISDYNNPIELCAYIQHQHSKLYLVTLNGRFELKTLQDVKDNIQYQFVQYIFRGEEVSADSPLRGQYVHVSVFDPRSDVDDCPTDNSTGYLCGTDENHVELRPEETVENLRILEDKDPRFFYRKPASEKCVCFESLKYEDHYLAVARSSGNDYRIKLKRVDRKTRDSDPDIQFLDWYVKLRGCCETDSTGVGSSMRPVSELL